MKCCWEYETRLLKWNTSSSEADLLSACPNIQFRFWSKIWYEMNSQSSLSFKPVKEEGGWRTTVRPAAPDSSRGHPPRLCLSVVTKICSTPDPSAVSIISMFVKTRTEMPISYCRRWERREGHALMFWCLLRGVTARFRNKFWLKVY